MVRSLVDFCVRRSVPVTLLMWTLLSKRCFASRVVMLRWRTGVVGMRMPCSLCRLSVLAFWNRRVWG